MSPVLLVRLLNQLEWPPAEEPVVLKIYDRRCLIGIREENDGDRSWTTEKEKAYRARLAGEHDKPELDDWFDFFGDKEDEGNLES